MARVDVRSEKSGSWVVISSNGQNVRKEFHRQRDAQAEARRLAQQAGGGEVVIHARTGRVADRLTVPPKAGKAKQRTKRKRLLDRMASR